jgi:type IV secretory pathway VirJ component
MKRSLAWFMILFAACACAQCNAEESAFEFGRFGKVAIYRNTVHPAHLIFFLSGDGGWNQGVVDMARALADLNALVVGIDLTHYLKELNTGDEPCSYPAGEFESFSHYIQKKFEYPNYVRPILFGYSSGATLAYAVLAQAPTGTFLCAVSMGFCPDLDAVHPFCKGSGLTMQKGPRGKGVSFLPATHLKDPWVALQGTIDEVCNPQATESFTKMVNTGEIVMLPKVGHGFSVPANWMPQLKTVFMQLAERQSAEQKAINEKLDDLPLVEVPASGNIRSTMAVLVTGDGGWAGLDQDVSQALSRGGVAVVGLNSLKYFWKSRTPDIAAKDLARIMDYYLSRWEKADILLVGYSLGADVLPFMADRLPEALLKKVRSIVLFGPSHKTAFEFHLSDWIGGSGGPQYPVLPEVEKIKDKKILCIKGEEEGDSLCSAPLPSSVKVITLPGGHHFSGQYGRVIDEVLNELP